MDKEQPKTYKQTPDAIVPIGDDFLELISTHERECEAKFDHWLASAGDLAPRIMAALGTGLSYMDRLASCWWHCRKGDHLEERLVGRALNNAKASLRLAKLGFYDESLGITRQIGETANLLCLFISSKESRSDWQSANDAELRNRFSAGHVRRRLDALGAFIPMDRQTYERLSTLSVHLMPNTAPENYNPFGIATVYNQFQEAGALVSLNHLAESVSWTLALGAVLIQPPEKNSDIKDVAVEMMTSVGKANVNSLQDYWLKVRKAPGYEEAKVALRQRDWAMRSDLWSRQSGLENSKQGNSK